MNNTLRVFMEGQNLFNIQFGNIMFKSLFQFLVSNVILIIEYQNQDMLRSKLEHGSQSGLIGYFAPQLIEHHHLAKKSQTALESIMHDHNITALNWFSAVTKGVGIAVVFGIFGSLTKRGSKQFFTDRAILNNTLYFRKFRFHIAAGAIAGTVWFFLNQILCPHGGVTYQRKLLTYGISGGILASTLWMPSAFFYGSTAGVILGSLYAQKHWKQYPRGFQARIENFDKKRREKVLRDDQQLQLSRQYMKAFGNKQLKQL